MVIALAHWLKMIQHYVVVEILEKTMIKLAIVVYIRRRYNGIEF